MTTKNNVASFNNSTWSGFDDSPSLRAQVRREFSSQGVGFPSEVGMAVMSDRILERHEDKTNRGETLDREHTSQVTPTWEEIREERAIWDFMESDIPGRVQRGFEFINTLKGKKDEAYHMYAGFKWDREVYYERKDWKEFRKARDLARQWWGYLNKIQDKGKRAWDKLNALRAEQDRLLEKGNPARIWAEWFKLADEVGGISPYLTYGEVEEQEVTREDEWQTIFEGSRMEEIQEENLLEYLTDNEVLGEYVPVENPATAEEWWESLMEGIDD